MTRSPLLILLTLIGLAFPTGALSAGTDESSHLRRQAERVIRVLAMDMPGSPGKHIRKPPPGIPGDIVVGRDQLRNFVPQFGKPKGAVVGQDRYRTVFETRAIGIVEVTTTLPGGTIQARGRADFRRASNVIRIIGGTGVFSRARGTSEQRVLPNDQVLNVYRVRVSG